MFMTWMPKDDRLLRCERKERTYQLTKMLLSRQTLAIRLLTLCFTVYVSLALDASHDIPESADENCDFKLAFRKYQLILSWELKNRSIVPTHSTFQYTIMSKKESMKTVENCTNITRSFCDLTNVWQDMHETYIPMVEEFRGETLLVQCLGSITALNLSFEPPDFGIIGFADHINVVVQFPPVAPTIYGEDLHDQASLIIKEHSEDIDKRHEPKISGSFSGNFSYVINNLIPNTNYCISVYFEPRSSRTITKPPLKCVLLQPAQESGSSKSVKIVIVIVIFVSVAISIILTLRQIGYVCLHTEFPKVLIFHNFVVRIFPELPLSEEVNILEVISINKKKKVWGYNYGDESDSEDEAPLRTIAGGYTMHGLPGRLHSQVRTSPASSQASHLGDPADEESKEPERETQPQPQPPAAQGPSPGQKEGTSEPSERTEGLPQDPCPKVDDGNSSGGSGDKMTFNVDLNSVFLRVLHDDEEDSEEAALVLPPPEEVVDLEEDPQEMESSLLVPGGEKLQVLFPNLPPECLWTGDDLSDKSDTSSSDVDDIRDGYIMR
ncbi:interferon alpha/beta receptor 2 isoform X2 [Heterocephalus glaber]|uniref:Interferon alpha/beta receptor 2 n=1 Tax=Heterocephalus glaber TaxID=10181 RepID=A0A0P6JWN3_HETGA|nr:interferon alpha/beta receptor 2 isoform X2 [Heterocephalus glaber]